MNWQIGDRAIICGVPPAHQGYDINGEEVTLTSCEEDGRVCIEHIKCAAGIGARIWTKHLRPIPDNDSRQVTTWDNCIFTPRELVTV